MLLHYHAMQPCAACPLFSGPGRTHTVHAGPQDAPPEVRVIDFGCSQFVLDGTKLEKRTGEWSCHNAQDSAGAAGIRRRTETSAINDVALSTDCVQAHRCSCRRRCSCGTGARRQTSGRLAWSRTCCCQVRTDPGPLQHRDFTNECNCAACPRAVGLTALALLLQG